MLGFTIFDNFLISPCLLIPISKIPYRCFISKFTKLSGTPILLLKDFGEKYVSPYISSNFPSKDFNEVLPALPVIPIILALE